VFGSANIQRAEVSIVNPFDCPAENLVANETALRLLGIEVFTRDASAIMLIGNQSVARSAPSLPCVRFCVVVSTVQRAE
jgi:hypothetical protein